MQATLTQVNSRWIGILGTVVILALGTMIIRPFTLDRPHERVLSDAIVGFTVKKDISATHKQVIVGGAFTLDLTWKSGKNSTCEVFLRQIELYPKEKNLRLVIPPGKQFKGPCSEELINRILDEILKVRLNRLKFLNKPQSQYNLENMYKGLTEGIKALKELVHAQFSGS